MKVVFFGSPASALPSLRKLLESGHSVELVITQPDRPAGRGRKPRMGEVKKFGVEHGLPVYQPAKIRKDEAVMEKLRSAAADIHVIVAYGQIIPDPIIHLPRFRSVNVHFSLLPQYRGASPVEWAILNGEKSTGVTIFELNDKMDEGDILAKAGTGIGPRETAEELMARLAEIGAGLLIKTLDEIGSLPRVPQNHMLASYAPKISKADGRIHWREAALLIDRKVRALKAWPTAYAFFKGKRVQIRKGRDIEGIFTAGMPGEVLAVREFGIDVCCGKGTIFRIESIQPENGKEMHAYAFSLGSRIKAGDCLE